MSRSPFKKGTHILKKGWKWIKSKAKPVRKRGK